MNGPETILRTEALCAGYERKAVVSGVTLRIRGGQILSLVGPNGAGKSTILKTIAGQLEPLGGTVFLDEKSWKSYTPPEIARLQAVMLTERLSAEQMTCEEVVSLGRTPYTGRLGILSPEDRRIVEQSMALVKVDDLRDRDYRAVSDGQRQRVLLARAIAQDPSVMILDEPTSYLDIRHKLEFLDLLRTLARERGIGVVLSLHELEFAHLISDEVVCVAGDGSILKTGRPAEVLTDARISELYGLEPGRLTGLYRGFLGSITGEEPHG